MTAAEALRALLELAEVGSNTMPLPFGDEQQNPLVGTDATMVQSPSGLEFYIDVHGQRFTFGYISNRRPA